MVNARGSTLLLPQTAEAESSESQSEAPGVPQQGARKVRNLSLRLDT